MSEENYCMDCRRRTTVVLDRASGDAVCLECGLVLESRFIDETAEWRNFADDSGGHDPNRVGSPVNPLLGDTALSTVVSGGPVSRMSRLCRRPDPDNVVFAFSTIADMAERLSLVATIKDRACEMYRKLHDLKSRRGKKLEILAAACIFIACRQEGKSRTVKEVCSIVNGREFINRTRMKEFNRAVEFIKEKMMVEMGESFIEVGTANAGDYLKRFCSKLGMSHEDTRTVRETIHNSEQLDIRRSPTSIAAAVIFMINQLTGSKISLTDIARATMVGEGTIKNTYRDIQPYAHRILPERYVKGWDLKKLGPVGA
ncbi:UNVERIFIED_CONTAM: Transcription initiation factor IIB [Sesamum calycinum]|uniref:Transcription initiation factor IIB n=1 Tax=Sesamum calycinum TaxID=2727403 RepID=A0AAW2RTB3_9LAMI